jgi:hypothetical protein
MSDVDKLLDAFAAGELLRPSSEVLNIVDLSRALALLAGANGVQSTPEAARVADLIGPCDHLIFILADGAGMNIVEELPDDAFLPAHLVTELRTVFPSTTAVVLTTIATGEWPAQHAITGWWTHLPEIGAAATILPFVRRSDDRPLAELGVTTEQAFPLPSVMGALRRDTLSLLPEKIAGSVYSAYFSGGSARGGYKTLRGAVDVILARVRAAQGPTFTHLYWDRVDEVAHRYGAGRPEVLTAIVELDREVRRLSDGLGGRGRIVLTADHGFLDTRDGARHWIRPSDALMDSLRYNPSGDARVLYLHVRDGAEARVRESFRRRFGSRFLLIATDEAEELELFGPGALSPQTKSRVGDLMAVSMGPDVIMYRPSGNTGKALLKVSHHSGLTPAEMRIPLVVA